MEVITLSQSLPERLEMMEEKNVLIQGLPSTVEKQFVKLSFSKNVTPLLKKRKIEFALVFAVSQRQLIGILNDVVPALNGTAKLWVAYPKPTSKIASDLTRICNWSCVEQYGLEIDHKLVIDHVWEAIRFRKYSAKNLSKSKVAAKALAEAV